MGVCWEKKPRKFDVDSQLFMLVLFYVLLLACFCSEISIFDLKRFSNLNLSLVM